MYFAPSRRQLVTPTRRFESCWPAIIKDVHGVLLVYNPEIPTHDIEVGIWWVARNRVEHHTVSVIAHSSIA